MHLEIGVKSNRAKSRGVFYCLETFAPSEISTWVPESGGGETAVCPRCQIDSVIGSASGVNMSDDFFAEMAGYWFDAAGHGR